MNLPATSLLLRAQAQTEPYTDEDAPPAPNRSRRPRRRRNQADLCLTFGVLSGAALFVLFLLIGSDLIVTSLLCGAWMVGWMAVAVAGGFRTLTGWFAFFPMFHFILFSLPLKVLFWEPAEQRLRAPLSTSLVMLLFYVGILCAVLVCRWMKVGSKPLCAAGDNPEFYRWLAWTCFVFGTVAYLVNQLHSGADDAGDSAGGLGALSFIAAFKDLSIAGYVFYAWQSGKNVWKMPSLWLFLVVGVGSGVLASAKGGTSQPVVYLLVATCCIYGLRSFKLIIGCAIFGLIFSSVIYPVMHYARSQQGARSGSMVDRALLMADIIQSYATDARFRATADSEVNDYANSRATIYLPESAGVFDRFIMIGPTDLLVAGVDESSKTKQFHGFELFRQGLELMVPRFLNPDKSDVGSSEALAAIAGTRNAAERTNPTWGVPAQLYYSLGFSGVLLGTFAIELVFFLLINLWFGSQVSKSLWFCLLAVSMNMSNSCAGVDYMPLLGASLFLPSLALCKFAALVSRYLSLRFGRA